MQAFLPENICFALMDSAKLKLYEKMGKFGSIKLVPMVILLILVGSLLILRVEKSDFARPQISEKREVDEEWNSYLTSGLRRHWNWVMNGGDNGYTSTCNFEDYVFGQPTKQDDPCLISTFKKKLLISPPPISEQNHDFNVSNELPSNIEKFKWVQKLLIKSKPSTASEGDSKGFFIECGANDGTFISPTIRLEKELNWTGLLIEANPIPFKSLLKKKRNAWAANVAMCTTEHPKQITFYTNPSSTGLSGINARVEHGVKVNITVQCIPLYTMIKALDINTVDYFSLDVEGLELAILKTVPFDKIKFKILTIEYGLIPGKQEALREFLEPRGYRFVKDIRDSLTQDCMYVHESLYSLASSVNI